jgi:hypothetical protein
LVDTSFPRASTCGGRLNLRFHHIHLVILMPNRFKTKQPITLGNCRGQVKSAFSITPSRGLTARASKYPTAKDDW